MRPIQRVYFAKGWDHRAHNEQLILIRDELRRRARELREDVRTQDAEREARLLQELANDVDELERMREAWLEERNQ